MIPEGLSGLPRQRCIAVNSEGEYTLLGARAFLKSLLLAKNSQKLWEGSRGLVHAPLPPSGWPDLAPPELIWGGTARQCHAEGFCPLPGQAITTRQVQARLRSRPSTALCPTVCPTAHVNPRQYCTPYRIVNPVCAQSVSASVATATTMLRFFLRYCLRLWSCPRRASGPTRQRRASSAFISALTLPSSLPNHERSVRAFVWLTGRATARD